MMIDLIPWSDTTYEGVSLHAELDFPHGANRGQVVKLTAGGVYVHDGGYHHEDREAAITAHLRSKAQAEALESLHVNRVVLYFSDEFGTYKAQIKDLNVVSRPAIISLIILEKLMLFQDMVYPPAPVWIDVTSDTYWRGDIVSYCGSCAPLSWSGSAWIGSASNSSLKGNFRLVPAGTDTEWIIPVDSWVIGYKPTKFRITYSYVLTGSTAYAYYRNWSYPLWNDLYQLNTIPIVSGESYDIDWDNPDEGTAEEAEHIYSCFDMAFIVPTLNPYTINISITKIELYGVSPL